MRTIGKGRFNFFKLICFLFALAALQISCGSEQGQGPLATGLRPIKGGPSLAWYPSTHGVYNFGVADPSQTVSQTFTLNNSFGSPSAPVTITLSGSPEFTITGNTCSQPGTIIFREKNCTVTVAYKPSGTGQDSATLTAVSKMPLISASLKLNGANAISGTVSGDVVAGVRIDLTGPSGGSTTTDASGNYSFTGLVNGSYKLWPSNTGYTFLPSNLTVTLNNADDNGQNFTSTAIPWASVPSGTTASLYGVWGSSSFGVWAVGSSGTILHWDGFTWSEDCIVVNAGGILVCEIEIPGSFNGVWGSSASDVWAVGSGGKIVHYDGSSWSWASSGTTNNLFGVWGSSSSDAWAVGYLGTTMGWNGSWSNVTNPISGYEILHAVWGSSASKVWAVGSNGHILQWDGSEWLWWPSWDVDTTHGLNAVWGSSASDVWAVGDYSTILHNAGEAPWVKVPHPSSGGNPLYGIWGSAANDVWTVGDGGTILHWNGTSWVSVPSGTTANLKAVWGTQTKLWEHIWAVGDGGIILRLDAPILN